MTLSNIVATVRVFFYFLIQQFVTWDARADRGSYNVTTLHKKETMWKRKRKGNER